MHYRARHRWRPASRQIGGSGKHCWHKRFRECSQGTSCMLLIMCKALSLNQHDGHSTEVTRWTESLFNL